MTNEVIQNKLQDIFREVFDIEDLLLSASTSPDDIEDWDSLEQINILSAAEGEFHIKFDLNEVMGIENVGDIVRLIAKKVQPS